MAFHNTWLIAGTLITALLVFLLGWYLYHRARIQRRRRPEGLPYKDSQIEEVEGVQIHFVQNGGGPHLVLLHGIGANVYTWRLVRPILGKVFTVTAIDLPGFGHSSKPIDRNYDLETQAQSVLSLLKKIGIKDFSLCGSSMGGAIALWMAFRAPERVKRLVCISPAVIPGLVPLDLQWLVPVIPKMRFIVSPRLVKHIMARTVTDKSLVHDEAITTYLNPYLDEGTSAQVFIKALKAIQEPRLPEVLPQIRTPVLFLWGEKDQMNPYKHEKYLREIFVHAKFLSLSTAGHHPMEDSPAWTSQSMIEFLTKS